MKSWVDLYDYALADIPDCSHFMAANALRRAAQEFCARTKAWRVNLGAKRLVAGISAYDFDVEPTQEVCELISATLDGQPIDPLTPEQSGSGARGVLLLSEREYSVEPTPAGSAILRMRVALRPSNTATGIEDFLFAAYAKDIGKGAKAELFGMTNQPFSNPGAAQAERGEFDAAIARTALRVAKGFSGAPLRTRPSFL